ncbi:MAG: hypothetical protein ACI4UT_01370 [Candidatus Enteromonas sp.]
MANNILSKGLFFLSLPLLLVSCGNPGTGEGENKTTFYQNLDAGDETVLYVVDQVEGKVENPGTPLVNRFVFDGWYEEREGGERFDFSSAAPASLYAHWVVYSDLTDAEKLSRYVTRIQDMCPLVSETRAHVESVIAYSTAESPFYTVDNFVAKRYEGVTEIRHYYPKVCYSEADLSSEEVAAGKSVEEVNAANLTLLEQDFYEDGKFYAFYDYNELHPNASSGQEDGKDVIACSEAIGESYLSIDFSSYFMGWASQLAYLLKNNPAMSPNNSVSEDFGNNSYWIKEMNVSTLDDTKSSGAFAFAYTYSQDTEQGMTWTTLYQSTAEFAIVDGKIRHCQVSKIMNQYLDGSALMSLQSVSLFDFDSVEALAPFEGERFSPGDTRFPTYEE